MRHGLYRRARGPATRQALEGAWHLIGWSSAAWKLRLTSARVARHSITTHIVDVRCKIRGNRVAAADLRYGEPHEDHSRERRCSNPSAQVGAMLKDSGVDGAHREQRRDGELRDTEQRWPCVSNF